MAVMEILVDTENVVDLDELQALNGVKRVVF